VVFIYNGILFSYKEERNFVFCRKMNGAREHHLKIARFRKTRATCFLSNVDRSKRYTYAQNKHDHIQTHMQNMFAIAELLCGT
jgi:putative flippase GtrA